MYTYIEMKVGTARWLHSAMSVDTEGPSQGNIINISDIIKNDSTRAE